jgi:hypothetical protein
MSYYQWQQEYLKKAKEDRALREQRDRAQGTNTFDANQRALTGGDSTGALWGAAFDMNDPTRRPSSGISTMRDGFGGAKDFPSGGGASSPFTAANQAYQSETERMGIQGQADGARMNAYANLGGAGMNAMGQYGSHVANSLANQSIAAGNTFGGMANNYYNTMGQMGHIGGALSAAGLAASSNAASAQMAGNMGLNIGGGFGGGGFGDGGFNVSGPGGNVASGSQGGWGGGWGGSMGGGSQGGWNNSVQRGGSEAERGNILGQGFNYLGQTMGHLNNPNNPAMALAGLANKQFNQNRDATMNPQFMNSMNNMFTQSNKSMGQVGQPKR